MRILKFILSIIVTVLDIIIAVEVLKKLKEDKELICFSPDAEK